MRGYSTAEVARLLALSPAQVRSHARAAGLAPSRGSRGEYRFSFQDLIVLRAAKELIAQRIPASRVRRALRKLAQQLPRGRSVTELRITAEGDRVIARDGEAAWNPESGQMTLDFAIADLADEAAPLTRGRVEAFEAAAADRTAEEWHDLGLDLEPVAPVEAADAYRRCLELDPDHPDAHVNLGRLLQEQGRLAAAEAHYRRALHGRHAHPLAAFNLGTVLEDLGRLDEAMDAYEDALARDPSFADAHFNVALLYEKAGDRQQALRHLKAYKAIVEGR
jgi:tetratricopeptide (TPR) repeat protein